MGQVRTPIRIEGGWLDSHFIRRARKPGRCDFFRSLKEGRCRAVIAAGELYAEGEGNDDAGGYGNDRYCLGCAGDEARLSVLKAVRENCTSHPEHQQ